VQLPSCLHVLKGRAPCCPAHTHSCCGHQYTLPPAHLHPPLHTKQGLSEEQAIESTRSPMLWTPLHPPISPLSPTFAPHKTQGLTEEQAIESNPNLDIYTSSFRAMRNTLSGGWAAGGGIRRAETHQCASATSSQTHRLTYFGLALPQLAAPLSNALPPRPSKCCPATPPLARPPTRRLPAAVLDEDDCGRGHARGAGRAHGGRPRGGDHAGARQGVAGAVRPEGPCGAGALALV